jgi:hypothetical protein
MNTENDEIDLTDLYQAFKQTKTHTILSNNISLLLRNSIWVILIVILGGIGGYFLEKSITPIYRSEMIIDSKYLDNYTCNQIISSIDTLIDDNNHIELANEGFDTALSESLKSIQFIYPEQGPDTLKMKEPFRVAAFTTKPNTFSNIESALLQFLFRNKASHKNHISKERLLIAEKALLTTEILSIDSMSNVLEYFIKSNKTSSKVFDPASLIKEKKNSQLRLKQIEEEMTNISNFVVLKSFTPRITPEKTNNYYIIKFGILGFILGFLLIKLFRK